MKIYVNTDYISKVFRVVHGFPEVKIDILDRAITNTFESMAKDNKVSVSAFANTIEFCAASAHAGEKRLSIKLATFNSTTIFPIQAIQSFMDRQKDKNNRIIPVLLEVTAEDLQSPEDYIIPVMSLSKTHPEKNFMVTSINWRTLAANAQTAPDKDTHVFLYPIIIDLNAKVIGTMAPEAVQSRIFAKQEDDHETFGE